MSTTVKIGLWLLAVALAIPLFLSGAYCLHGSLEQFPTDEQQGEARIASGFSFMVFAFLEAIVLIKLLGKGGIKSSVVVVNPPVNDAASPPSEKMNN